jgi:LemA protein
MGVLIFLVMIVALLISGWIYLNNDLIGKKNQIERAFASIDVLLKKRCDLIPNLVAIAQQYMEFEKETFTRIAGLRSRAMSGRLSTDERMSIENQITRDLSDFFVSVESYPELRSNQQFLDLQAAINEAEEQISAARRFYNTAVNEFNNAVEMFPSNIVAGFMRLRPQAFFAIEERERQSVDVHQLFKRS